MKKLTAFVLAVMLCVTLAAPACAQQTNYANTRAFLRLLEEQEVLYTYEGLDSDNDEVVKVPVGDDDFDCTLTYFFCEDNELVSIRVWNVIDFRAADLTDMLRVVNRMNYDYRFATFYVDESDNSITVSMDLIVREGNASGVIWEATCYLVEILDDAYGTLAPYAK